MKHVTLCIPISDPTGQILLGEKLRGFGQGKIVGFGGKIEPGETAVEAAARELHEEAGLLAAPQHLEEVAVLTFCFPTRPDWDHLVHVFLTRNWIGEPSGSAEITAQWYPIDAVPYQRMWDDACIWLPRLLAGDRLRGTFIYADDQETVLDYRLEQAVRSVDEP